MKKIFTLLTLLLCAITSSWAVADFTYSIGATAGETILAADGSTYSTTIAGSSTGLKNKTLWVEVPSSTSSGYVSFYGNGNNSDRHVYILKTNGTVVDNTRYITMVSGWNAEADAISFNSGDILTSGGKYYLVFQSGSEDYKFKGVKYTIATLYNVTYKAGKGTGADIVTVASKFAANTFTAPTGKVFLNWNTNEDGSGTGYNVGDVIPSDNLVLYAQWAYQMFSMTDVTGPTSSIAKQSSADVTATFNTGSSATVYNGHGSNNKVMVNASNEIDLGGSGNSYFCATFTTALKEGDVISCGKNTTFKIGATSSSSSVETFPYTIPADHALIGKTSVYIFKDNDGGSTFSTFTILRPAVTPEFSLVETSVAANETTQIQVGTKGNLDGITFDGDVTFGTDGIVTVNAAGVVTPVSTGTTTINFSTNAVREYYATTGNSLSITVTAAKTETTLSFGSPTTTVARGANVTNAASLTETVGGSPVVGTITYSSDDETIATVDEDGKVIGVKVGTTTIRANYAGDATYAAAAEVTYDITVTLPALTAVSNKIWNTNESVWTALEGDITATDVVDNMEIVATSSKKMTISTGGTPQGHSDFDSGFTSRIKTLGKPGSSNDARYLHFKAAANSMVSAYFIQGTTGVNVAGYSLGTLDSEHPTGTYTNTGDGVDKMVFTTDGSETDVYLYSVSDDGSRGVQFVAVKVQPFVTIPVGATGWSTYSSDQALDFTTGLEIEAYQVTGYSGTAITKSKIDGTVAANTGLLVKGTPSTNYNVPVVASGTDYSATNKMVASVSGGTVNAGDMGVVNYVLMNVSGNAVFQWIGSTPATLGANKAYLSISGGPKPAGARGLSIDDEVTAIKNIKVGTEDNVYYDLNGRRVLYPTKGLYIVNGKKIVVK